MMTCGSRLNMRISRVFFGCEKIRHYLRDYTTSTDQVKGLPDDDPPYSVALKAV